MEGTLIQLDLDANQSRIDGFWRSWFSAPAGYGRDVFYKYGPEEGKREFITHPQEFGTYLRWCDSNLRPAWLTVQPCRGRNSVVVIEKLFFDLDCKNAPSAAWEESHKLANSLKTDYGAKPLVCFSGLKGYHVYVWLSEPQVFDEEIKAKRFYKTAQQLILKGLGLKTSDRNVLGDIKRLSRVPYSVHQESLNRCVPVDDDQNPALLDDVGEFKENGLSENFVKLCQRKSAYDPPAFVKPLAIRDNEKEVRSCIQAALNSELAGTSGHSMRVAIAIEYHKAGYKPEQIAQLFKSQPDYDYQKSLYYSNHIAQKNYIPYSCSRIRELGFCKPSCILSKLINSAVKNEPSTSKEEH